MMEQFYDGHAQDAQQRLQQLLGQNTDSSFTERMCSRYYREGGEWLWMRHYAQLAKCDTIDSLLNRQVSAMGFSPAYFSLPDIHQALEAMHTPDSVQGLPDIMAQTELNLTKACLRYMVGQRFGFTTPSKLFGANNYDIALEQADTAFVEGLLQELKDMDTMKSFLATVEPQDSAYLLLKRKLATDSVEDERMLTLCNMERLRWRDKKHPEQAERHIFVNIASQQVWAIAPDSVINMRICCGKVATKTPLLSSEVHLIQVNPEWGIPQSIIRNEISGRAGDSAYFARRNYYITNSSGQRVDPRSISSADLRSGRYAIRQRSGPGNSLGRIIFRFANRFSVYLHDTSSPGAFNKESRTISHGCVRLQRPFDMAEFVLAGADEWQLDQMRLSMDLKPKTERGKEYKRTHGGAIRLINQVDVNPKVPVVINYFTLYPNPQTGKLDHWKDVYGYDKIIAKAIKPFLP